MRRTLQHYTKSGAPAGTISIVVPDKLVRIISVRVQLTNHISGDRVRLHFQDAGGNPIISVCTGPTNTTDPTAAFSLGGTTNPSDPVGGDTMPCGPLPNIWIPPDFIIRNLNAEAEGGPSILSWVIVRELAELE